MSLMLMKDPKKLAALLLEKRGKREEAPKTEDGALKDHSVTGRADFAAEMFSAIDARDAESFINAFRQLSQSMTEERTDDQEDDRTDSEPRHSHHDLPSIEDIANGDSRND